MLERALSWTLTGHPPQAAPKPPARTELEIHPFRRWMVPLLLLTTTPLLVIVLWMVAVHYEGSFLLFATTVDLDAFVTLAPRPTLFAVEVVVGWIALQTVLLLFLPGKPVEGPITPSGVRPVYKDNGIAAWIITHALVVGGWAAGLYRASSVIDAFGSILLVLNVFALIFCVFLYWKGRTHPSSPDAVYTGHPAFDFFQGVELHPTLFGVQLKQLFNCRVSMLGWSVLVLLFSGAQIEATGALSAGMAVSTALLVLYLLKFFVWESGYFASLDIMHDRFGYYICWGVLVWVPSVYTTFSQYLVLHPSNLPLPVALGVFVLGIGALWMNYAADAQRQRVRATGGKTKVWGKEPKTLVAKYTTADGAARENLLLVSGYWGLARHFHYLPELTLAFAWTVPAGFGDLFPYFYLVFLTILLVDRAGRDDLRCHKKYGATWEEYRRLVPKKIIPGVF